MEETQNELDLAVGTKEAVSLKPAKVKIVNTQIVEVGEKGNKKVVCTVKHPDKEETVDISSVKYEKNQKLQVTGLWFNLDEDGLVRKGSALAILMGTLNAKTIKDLNEKEVDTTGDDKGYLCLKAY